ncbi:hypothetical protein AYI82_03520 [Shewanella algae]|nr:hypothetical protein AYI82_03520 [Shewanella algae]
MPIPHTANAKTSTGQIIAKPLINISNAAATQSTHTTANTLKVIAAHTNASIAVIRVNTQLQFRHPAIKTGYPKSPLT